MRYQARIPTMPEINPSQLRESVRIKFAFITKLLSPPGTAAGAALKQKRLADKVCGARTRSGHRPRVIQHCTKIPENKLRFRGLGLKSNQTRMSLHPSSIQTITVGPGITPDHARRRSRFKRELQNCSWAIPPIGNCTLPRRFLFDC